jgi:hypothetical protein
MASEDDERSTASGLSQTSLSTAASCSSANSERTGAKAEYLQLKLDQHCGALFTRVKTGDRQLVCFHGKQSGACRRKGHKKGFELNLFSTVYSEPAPLL